MFIDEAQSLLEKPKNENVAAAQRHLPAIRVIKNTGLRTLYSSDTSMASEHCLFKNLVQTRLRRDYRNAVSAWIDQALPCFNL